MEKKNKGRWWGEPQAEEKPLGLRVENKEKEEKCGGGGESDEKG